MMKITRKDIESYWRVRAYVTENGLTDGNVSESLSGEIMLEVKADGASCELIFSGFHALEVEFFELNLLHLHPGYHYTPVGCHGIPKISHGGLIPSL